MRKGKSFWDRFKDEVLAPMAASAKENIMDKTAAETADTNENETPKAKKAGKAKAAKPAKGKAAKPKKEKPKTVADLKADRIKALVKELPADAEGLTAAYRSWIDDHHTAIITKASPEVFEQLAERRSAMMEKAGSVDAFGKEKWRRDDQLERLCAAPTLTIPKWGQEGLFLLENVAGSDIWVSVHRERSIYFYASSPLQRFIDLRGTTQFWFANQDSAFDKSLGVDGFARQVAESKLAPKPASPKTKTTDEADFEDDEEMFDIEDESDVGRYPTNWYVHDPASTVPRLPHADYPKALAEMGRGAILVRGQLDEKTVRVAFKMFQEWDAEYEARRKIKDRKYPEVEYSTPRVLRLHATLGLVATTEYPVDGQYLIADEIRLRRKRIEIRDNSSHFYNTNEHKVLRFVADASNPGVPEQVLPEDEKLIITLEESGALDPESPGIPFDELANLFPMLSGKEKAEFQANLKREGYRSDERIMLRAGKILDGRNRYEAALFAKFVTPEFRPDFSSNHRLHDAEGEIVSGPIDGIFEEFDSDIHGDALAYVISKNLKRRHLAEGGRAMVAAKLAKMKPGRPEKAAKKKKPAKPVKKGKAAVVPEPTPEPESPSGGGVSAAAAAEQLNVSPRSVESARYVLEHGAQELQDAVAQDKVAVSTAADLAKLPKDEQVALIRSDDKPAILAKAKEIRAEGQAQKRERRMEKIREISKGNNGPLPENKFAIILADPPWKFETFSENGKDRSAENHYPCESLEALTAMQLGKVAGEDAICFMWATVPALFQAMKLMESWGFDYVSNFSWDKIVPGTGYWNRNQHEHLLFGTRGKFPAPLQTQLESSVISEKRGAHSVKPECIRVWIEEVWPDLPRIELFCRDARPGWDVWGNQSGAGDAEAAPEEASESAKPAASDDDADWEIIDSGALNDKQHSVNVGTFERSDGAWSAGFEAILGFIGQQKILPSAYSDRTSALSAARAAARAAIEPRRKEHPELIGKALQWLDDDINFVAPAGEPQAVDS